jgi:hypothetical protein
MNIDSINHIDAVFSQSIKEVMNGYAPLFQDPFIHVCNTCFFLISSFSRGYSSINIFKVNIAKFGKIRRIKEKINFLRETGRQKLMERIQMMQNQEELPNDILTNVLKACG